MQHILPFCDHRLFFATLVPNVVFFAMNSFLCAIIVASKQEARVEQFSPNTSNSKACSNSYKFIRVSFTAFESPFDLRIFYLGGALSQCRLPLNFFVFRSDGVPGSGRAVRSLQLPPHHTYPRARNHNFLRISTHHRVAHQGSSKKNKKYHVGLKSPPHTHVTVCPQIHVYLFSSAYP